MKKRDLFLVGFVAILSLSGCSSGGSDTPAVNTGGGGGGGDTFSNRVKQELLSAPDNTEPIDIDAIELTAPDNTEPDEI